MLVENLQDLTYTDIWRGRNSKGSTCHWQLSKEKFPDLIISIDTYKYRVAAAAFDAGADILNDIWGLQYDDGEMAELMSKNDLPIIAMHNQDERSL